MNKTKQRTYTEHHIDPLRLFESILTGNSTTKTVWVQIVTVIYFQ